MASMLFASRVQAELSFPLWDHGNFLGNTYGEKLPETESHEMDEAQEDGGRWKVERIFDEDMCFLSPKILERNNYPPGN